MRYLFVMGHPAHVHLFKNVMNLLTESGHQVLAAAVKREVTTDLLKVLDIQHAVFGNIQPTLLAKAIGPIPKEIALLRLARQFRPDLLVSTGSPYAAHVSAILAKPHLAFGDTERAALTARITIPFTDAVYTPDCYQGYLGPKHRKYNGYKELAYLHPKYFRPNRGSLDAAGLSETEPYLILRLASWDASHDLGESGFSFEDGQDALTFVRQMERLGRVVVTADSAVRPPLDEYTVRLSPERMHDVLAFATAYVGEVATMAAEAGVLGVPWIFVSSTGRGFLTDQQSRYGLGYWVRDRHGAEDALSHLALPNLRSEWQQRKERMLSEKEDVVSFITREIEKWPLGSVTG